MATLKGRSVTHLMHHKSRPTCAVSAREGVQHLCCRADHMWWASTPGRATHPNPQAPRCLPCDFDDSSFDKSLAPFTAPKGCPCTAQLLCETDERGIFNQYCDVPKAPLSTYSMHGGAGGIMSIGMMRAVTLDYMEKCVKSLYSTGTIHAVNALSACCRCFVCMLSMLCLHAVNALSACCQCCVCMPHQMLQPGVFRAAMILYFATVAL